MSKYQEQYNRMKRWYDRFEILQKGRPHDMHTDNYLDETYTFFMNCYHLKDWIKLDASVPTPVKQAVESHITSSLPLQLCADICNSLKHLRLTKKPRSSQKPVLGKQSIALTVGSAPTTISLKYEIDTTTGPIDAFDLATQCVNSWDAFLTANGLK
jgi:hypothetical protein